MGSRANTSLLTRLVVEAAAQESRCLLPSTCRLSKIRTPNSCPGIKLSSLRLARCRKSATVLILISQCDFRAEARAWDIGQVDRGDQNTFFDVTPVAGDLLRKRT